MSSMTKSRALDEEQRQDSDVNKRHYGKNVKFYPKLNHDLKLVGQGTEEPPASPVNTDLHLHPRQVARGGRGTVTKYLQGQECCQDNYYFYRYLKIDVEVWNKMKTLYRSLDLHRARRLNNDPVCASRHYSLVGCDLAKARLVLIIRVKSRT